MRPLLIVSLGNPGPGYATTRHSAGHILLKALASLPILSATPFRSDGTGLLAQTSDPDMKLWQSTSYMNESGKPVAAAWKLFEARHQGTQTETAAELSAPILQQVRLDPLTARPIAEPKKKSAKPQQGPLDTVTPHLVVLHDELELPLGVAKISSGAGRSARGHNGLKSMLSMPGMKAVDFTRVGIGIGPRPQGRGSDEVARFVLKKMSREEQDEIGFLAPKVLDALQSTREGKIFNGKVFSMK